MNNKIPLKKLADALAERSGVSSDDAMLFLKTLFQAAADMLYEGKSFSIVGLGTFRISHNPEDPVTFIPEKQFADDVNAPFAMFEPVAVASSVNVSELESITAPVINPVQQEASATELPPEPTSQVEEITETIVPEVIEVKAEVPAPVEPELEPEPDPEASHSEPEVSSPGCNPDSVSKPETQVEEADNAVVVDEVTETADNEPEVQAAIEAPETSVPDPEPHDTVFTPPSYDPESTLEADPDTQETVGVTYLPEDEEEYVEYNYPRKSRFGIGFLVGLLTGLIIGALTLVGYVIYFVNSGNKLF